MSDDIIKEIEKEVEKLYAESSLTLKFDKHDELMTIRKLRPAQVCLGRILISLPFFNNKSTEIKEGFCIKYACGSHFSNSISRFTFHLK